MATEFTSTAEVHAAPEAVWKVLATPTRWPGWTDSIETVELLDGVFEQGARVRISQPRLRTAVWTVTEYHPGRGFTWKSSTPGVVTTGEHEVLPAGEHARLRVAVRHTGPAAGLAGLLFGSRTRRYLTMEAEGLRAAAEQRSQADSATT